VTPRPDADAELRSVRRSGIPYTILRPLPVVERASDPDKPVLVTRQLAGAPATAVTADMVVDAVLQVVDGNACGQTLDIAPPPEMTWSELLAQSKTGRRMAGPRGSLVRRPHVRCIVVSPAPAAA